ncbi:CoA transferase [Mesorhizobium sp. M2A.F.Ca.ET.039.01.1.1]|uniref:CaiB/BaiF CoA transferase family protein n=1 Tax=Mesorhizobium sp. M2A.F.Ca.ET.039.01.1.1 TaxID=2496746 RepID=UPI001FE0C6A7|nr:CoA transferase [Mesorhizobium sp. M2A.F.Ca.ET.039.01.1.1]
MSHDHMIARGLPLDQLPVAQEGNKGFDLLEGVRVIDLTTSIAGPYAAQLLADFGADVIKVERPGGDDARAWGPPFLDGESLWFESVNRNKRSLCLDYNQPEGVRVLRDLAERADVFLINTSVRVAAKLGLDQETVRSWNPRLVYVSITGFGMTGPRSDLPCYDLIAEGYSGIMDVTGAADGDPQKVGAPAADMLAGQDAALAAIAALMRRARTNVGATVDIALVDSMSRFVACRIVPFLGSGEIPRRSGGKDSVIAIYQAFETADAPITLGLGNDNIWQRFWEALGKHEIAGDDRFASNALRRECRTEIVGLVQEVLLSKPRAHWLSLFARARIPAGPINRVDDLVSDRHLLERGLFYTLQSGDRKVPQVGIGIQVDGEVSRPRLGPPLLGEHSAEILESLLGYDQEHLTDLRRLKVV